MADNNWMDEYRVGGKPTTVPGTVVEDEDWTKQYRTKSKKSTKNIPRDKSIMERIPLVGGLATQYKDSESDWVDKIDAKNPGFRAAYYNNKKLEGVANDIIGSVATSAVSGPKLLTNMITQALYGGASRGKDIIADKGSDVKLSDIGDVGKSGAISALGPLAGRLLSPTSKNLGGLPKPPPVEKPTFESIKAGMRGGNKDALLDAFVRGRQQAIHAKNIEKTASSIKSGMGNLMDQPTSAAVRAFAGGAVPYMMGAHPLLTATGATLGAVAPHVPQMGAKYWNNQMNDAILKSIITSYGVNSP